MRGNDTKMTNEWSRSYDVVQYDVVQYDVVQYDVVQYDVVLGLSSRLSYKSFCMYILRYTLTPAPPSLQGRACTPLPVFFFSCFVLFILVRFITADPVPDRRVVCTHLIGKPFE